MPQAGKPNTIKLINQSIIRNIFMRRTALTCAEISAETGISITTVRSIMNEMLARGELVSLGLCESSGGRRSEQFIINDDCYEGISVCITQYDIYVSVVNIHAEIKETQKIPIKGCYQGLADILITVLKERINEKTRAVGIGVPGIVSSNGFIQKLGVEVLNTIDFLPPLKQYIDQAQYALPIIVENDLRASTLGFAKEIQNDSTVAFINFWFKDWCNQISAGFVEKYSIIHGMGNFAGELGLMPFDDTNDFREALNNRRNEEEGMEIIAKLLSWVCCTINPQHIMLCSGSEFFIDPDAIKEHVAKQLPAAMMPKISVGSHYKNYFIAGMASLTADAIFNSGEAAFLR